MKFLIMWQNINIAVLSEENSKIQYTVIEENLQSASDKGLIISPIVQNNKTNVLPAWINNRIPRSENDKFEYLKRTEGRLETDHIWFKTIE